MKKIKSFTNIFTFNIGEIKKPRTQNISGKRKVEASSRQQEAVQETIFSKLQFVEGKTLPCDTLPTIDI